MLKQQLPRLLIERRLRIRHYEQALDSEQHMSDSQLIVPILLERVDANLARLCHIGMEDFGKEVALGWSGRIVRSQL